MLLASAVPRVLTWLVHGSYLYYLSQARAEFYVPARPEEIDRLFGREASFPWPANIHPVLEDEVPSLQLNCVLFQSRNNYTHDQYRILGEDQRRLPRLYLEHDPPREHPTDTRHLVDDANVLLVHVTRFNQLMWDSGTTPTVVIEHGARIPDGVRYSGELPRGIVVVNNLPARGRRLGADIFQAAHSELPLDLVGMGSEQIGGLGEVPPTALPAFEAPYRFFFNPIRYTSLGLAVCEAMLVGLPIVALATTEMVTTVENDVSGYVDTDPARLVELMKHLLSDPGEAQRLGDGARFYAQSRFNINRFTRDWEDLFARVIESRRPRTPALSRPAPVSGGLY